MHIIRSEYFFKINTMSSSGCVFFSKTYIEVFIVFRDRIAVFNWDLKFVLNSAFTSKNFNSVEHSNFVFESVNAEMFVLKKQHPDDDIALMLKVFGVSNVYQHSSFLFFSNNDTKKLV